MKKVIEKHGEQHNILSLLPYSENAQLVNKHQKLDDLYFIKSIVDLSITALELFSTGNLILFDAQVGENLCQIRAYKMIILSQKWLYSSSAKGEFSKEIEQFKKYRSLLEHTIFDWENAIKHSNSYDKNLDATESINNFLIRHQLLFDLNDDFIFIIICYFLTHFNIRENKIPIAINLEFISREFHISKYRSKRLTHKYQQLICSLGNDFIIKTAQELPAAMGYIDILPALYQLSDENRGVLPCYTVSEIIFYHSIIKQVPILLIIHQLTELNQKLNHNKVIYCLLTGKKDKTELMLTPVSNYLSQHCMVVSGEVHYKIDTKESPEKYINRVLSKGPLKLILANTASHPQFSGKRLEAFRVNPFLLMACNDNAVNKNLHENKLLAMQRFALDSGCTRHNPTLFFLRHIYANSLKNEIDQLNNDYDDFSLDAGKIINHEDNE